MRRKTPLKRKTVKRKTVKRKTVKRKTVKRKTGGSGSKRERDDDDDKNRRQEKQIATQRRILKAQRNPKQQIIGRPEADIHGKRRGEDINPDRPDKRNQSTGNKTGYINFVEGMPPLPFQAYPGQNDAQPAGYGSVYF